MPTVEFLADETLANGIGGREHHLFEVVQALQNAEQCCGSFLLFRAGVVRRHDVPIQLLHRVPALAHLGHDVAILFLHVLEQLVLADDVALFGRIEQLSQLGWGQTTGWMARHLVVQASDVGGLRFADLGQLDRLSVRAEDTGSGHHAEGSGSSMSRSSLWVLS
ncbi:hypothetical protein D3C84_858970 [compost metagenome]